MFSLSSPMCCFQVKVETKDGSRDVNKFVYKPTKWMTNTKALAQALGKRCSNGNEPPFHRHIVLNGGLAEMASTYAPELVNTELRGLRQQMLDDGWISELELQFARANRSSTSKMSQPRSGRMNLTITQVHSFQEILCTQERWKRFVG